MPPSSEPTAVKMLSPETSSTLALVSAASTVVLAAYAYKLRAELAGGKKSTTTVTKTMTRNGAGEKLYTAEQLVAERRSVFPENYDATRSVPREILEKMLEAANWAPTHKRTEPWRFVVFETPAARQEVGELAATVYKKMVPEDKFMEGKYKKLVKNCTVSSHVIAICMKRQKSGNIPEWEEMCSVAMAVQNMHLVAASHGVGAYWSSGPPLLSGEMKAHCGMDGEGDKVLGLFYVAYPKKDAKMPKGARRPIKDKVTWVAK